MEQTTKKYIVPAISVTDRLNEALQRVSFSKYLKYWQMQYRTFKFEFENSDWNYTNFAYVDDHNVYAYISINWKRPENFIDNVSCINFFPEEKAIFATAIRKVLYYIVETLNVPKIEWGVIVGNPIEKAYDTFCRKHGGRIIGIKKNSTLIAGKYHDYKMYEWFNNKWVCSHCGHIERKESEIRCWKCGIGEMIYKNPFNFGQ